MIIGKLEVINVAVRKAKAGWEGKLIDGKGTVEVESGSAPII